MCARLCIYIAISMYIDIDIMLQEYGQRGSFEKEMGVGQKCSMSGTHMNLEVNS